MKSLFPSFISFLPKQCKEVSSNMYLRELCTTQNYPPLRDTNKNNSVSSRRAATPVRQAEKRTEKRSFAAAENSSQNFVVRIFALIVLSESESTSKFTSARIIYFKKSIVSHENFPVSNGQSLRTRRTNY